MMCGSEKGTMKCWRTQHVTSIRHRHQNLRKSWNQFWWSFDGISIRPVHESVLVMRAGVRWRSRQWGPSSKSYQIWMWVSSSKACWKLLKIWDKTAWSGNLGKQPETFSPQPMSSSWKPKNTILQYCSSLPRSWSSDGRNENGTLHPKSMSSDSVWNQPLFPRKCLQPEFRGASIGASGTASCIPQVLTQNNALKEDRQNETQLCKGGCSFKDHAGSVSSVWSFTRHRHVETPSFFQGARDLGDHWPQTGAWRRMTWGLPNFWASVGFSPQKWMVFDKND